jgi:hypothetical protein
LVCGGIAYFGPRSPRLRIDVAIFEFVIPLGIREPRGPLPDADCGRAEQRPKHTTIR